MNTDSSLEEVDKTTSETQATKQQEKTENNQGNSAKQISSAEICYSMPGMIVFYLIIIIVGALYTIGNTIISNDFSNLNMYGITGIISNAIYVSICIYAAYSLIAHKANAVYIALFQIILLACDRSLRIVENSLGIDSGIEITTLIVSLFYAIVFIIYFLASNNENSFIPKSKRKLFKRDKWIMSLSIIIPVLCFVYPIIDVLGMNPLTPKSSRFDSFVEERKMELPTQIDEGLIFYDYSIDEGYVKYDYELDVANLDLTPKELARIACCAKEDILRNPTLLQNEKLVLDLYTRNSLGIIFRYVNEKHEHLYDVQLTPEEVLEISKSDYKYTISADRWNSVLNSYNNLCPIEWYSDLRINRLSLDIIENELNCEIELVGFNLSSLSRLNGRTLKDFFKNALNEKPQSVFTMALETGMDIKFKVTSDEVEWWDTTVLINQSML